MLWRDYRIKRPKTNRYPSLKGTDPKFRRNHRHALHGTMKALVCLFLFLRIGRFCGLVSGANLVLRRRLRRGREMLRRIEGLGNVMRRRVRGGE